MNKGQLAEILAQKVGITKLVAEQVLNAYAETIEETLSKGEEVIFIGFGTFKVAERAARNGRNPLNGEPITISAAKVVKFHPSKKFKEAVNK